MSSAPGVVVETESPCYHGSATRSIRVVITSVRREFPTIAGRFSFVLNCCAPKQLRRAYRRAVSLHRHGLKLPSGRSASSLNAWPTRSVYFEANLVRSIELVCASGNPRNALISPAFSPAQRQVSHFLRNCYRMVSYEMNPSIPLRETAVLA